MMAFAFAGDDPNAPYNLGDGTNYQMREVRRRRVLALLGSAVVTWPLAVPAQDSNKRKLIACHSGQTREGAWPNLTSFLDGMRDLGYVEGRHFDMVYRFSGGFQDRISPQLEELIRLKPDLIFATAIISAVPAKKLTSTIPIVSAALADAVNLGLIASETRPGGNVTGIEPYVPGLPAKQIEFAREVVPGITRVGLLTNLRDPKAPPQVQELKQAANAFELDVVEADANVAEEIAPALQALSKQRANVVIVLQTSLFLSERQRIGAAALQERLPIVCGYREHVIAGGLISYGVDLRWCYHRVAYFVDKILHGTAPGDLPVEFPTSMMLSINLRTAKALGIAVSPTLLGLADETME
jgi:putative tryptophan/tyrosine transport system substrate-binding protein